MGGADDRGVRRRRRRRQRRHDVGDDGAHELDRRREHLERRSDERGRVDEHGRADEHGRVERPDEHDDRRQRENRAAVAESEAALETLVAVRDKVIQAYEDIMRMPI